MSQSIQNLSDLQKTFQSLSTISNVDKPFLFNEIIETATTITQADECCLFLLDQKNDELYLEAHRNLGDAHSKFAPNNLKDSLLERVIRDELPYCLEGNIRNDANIEIVPGHYVHSLLQVPFSIEEKVIGVLSAHNSIKQSDFSQVDLICLSILANHVTVILQRNQLTEIETELLLAESIAWAGIVGSTMMHSIIQKTSAIRKYLAVVKKFLPTETPKKLLELLDKVGNIVDSIQNSPVPREQPQKLSYVTPLPIKKTLYDQLENYFPHQTNIKLELKNLISPPEAQVRINQNWLMVVVEQLLTNSLRAMPDEGVLEVISTLRNGWIDLDFKDNGHGIPDSVRPYFLQGPIPKNKKEDGMGIGLLIARRIIHHYNGNIKLLHSSSEEGTTLRISLPIDKGG